MALQTFTAGQVLTAAQVNALQANDYNQTVSTKTGDYVLVAADKGTRVVMNSGSAQTITVNTSLFNAGDTLFIHNIGAGICTITAGTATVSTAGSLALPQNAGGTLYFTSAGVSIFFPTVSSAGAQGLTFIKSQVIGTTVSSVNVTGAFSATYDAYKIIISGGISSANTNIALQLGSTTTGYYAGYVFINYSTNAVTGPSDNNGASFTLAAYSSQNNAISLNAELISPFLSKPTIFNTFVAQATSGGGSRIGTGFQAATTSFTDFTLTPSSGTLTGGTIRVYGYNN